MRNGLLYLISDESSAARQEIVKARLAGHAKKHNKSLGVIVRELHRCSRQSRTCRNCPDLKECLRIYISLC